MCSKELCVLGKSLPLPYVLSFPGFSLFCKTSAKQVSDGGKYVAPKTILHWSSENWLLINGKVYHCHFHSNPENNDSGHSYSYIWFINKCIPLESWSINSFSIKFFTITWFSYNIFFHLFSQFLYASHEYPNFFVWLQVFSENNINSSPSIKSLFAI